jgi:hypothetical protein
MNTIQEFINFIEGLDDSVVTFNLLDKYLDEHENEIDLKILTKDIADYSSLQVWLKNIIQSSYLKDCIIKSILKINPPENVKNELLSIML